MKKAEYLLNVLGTAGAALLVVVWSILLYNQFKPDLNSTVTINHVHLHLVGFDGGGRLDEEFILPQKGDKTIASNASKQK